MIGKTDIPKPMAFPRRQEESSAALLLFLPDVQEWFSGIRHTTGDIGKTIRKTIFCKYNGCRKSRNPQISRNQSSTILREVWLARKTHVS
jgi:hypothetical protein